MSIEIDPKVENFVRSRESSKRFQHSLRVAEFARELAERNGVNQEKVVLAAVIHDIGREMRKKELRSWTAKYYQIDAVERRQILLLHGKAGAALAREKLGIEDEEVLEAVMYHTTGKPGMSGVAKVVFIADNAEPDRKHSTQEYREWILSSPIDEVLKKMIEEQVDFLQKKGKSIADVTAALYVELTRGIDIVET